METKLLQVTDPQHDIEAIRTVAAILQDGGVAAIPTETVYGLAADALNPEAVAKIFEAKGRPADNPLIVHIVDLKDLPKLAREIPQAMYDLAEAFWPGPLTVILKKQDCVPLITTGGLETVAIRFPSDPVAQAIIRESGLPLAAPSANRSGSPSPTNARRCVEDLTGRVDAIVDGGECQVGVESTVLTLAGGKPRLLRPGYVTVEQLREVLGEVEVDKAVLSQLEEGQVAASPGMKYKHYAPQAKVILLDGDDRAFADYVNAQEGEGIWALAFGSETELLQKPYMVMGETSDEQAHYLFESLRELDDKGAKLVFARCPRKDGVGMAVYNRIARAAAFTIIKL